LGPAPAPGCDEPTPRYQTQSNSEYFKWIEESKGDDLYSIVQKDISEMLCHIDVDPLDYMKF